VAAGAGATTTPADATAQVGGINQTLAALSQLSPLLTVVVLAGTLALQTFQFGASERDRRADNERQSWEAAVAASTGPDKVAASIRLKGFLHTKYAKDARELAYYILLQNRDQRLFESLFASAFQPITWDGTLPYVLLLNREIGKWDGPLETKYWQQHNLSQDEEAQTSYARFAIGYISGQLALLLRRPRPAGTQVDLSDIAMWECDLSNVDLSGANLTGFWAWRVRWDRVDLRGCRFGGWERWDENAWWRAAYMSAELLDYLQAKYAYDAGKTYNLQTSQDEYDAGVARLREGKPPASPRGEP